MPGSRDLRGYGRAAVTRDLAAPALLGPANGRRGHSGDPEYGIKTSCATWTVMIIHPSALPPGAGVAINPPVQPALQVAVGLVHTSAQCTGT